MAEENATLTISKEESQRISVFKVWLSIMVVFIHAYDTNMYFAGDTVTFADPAWLDTMKYLVSQALSGSAVPAFFFLSAYLLYRKPFVWKQNIRKKAKSLLIPYFLLNALWILIFFIAQNIPVTQPFFSNPENIVANWGLAEWATRFFGSPTDLFPMLYPLWFVRTLFILNVLSFAFDWFVEKLGRYSLVIFILGWLFIETTHVFFLSIQAICFWGLGCYFAKRKISISSFDKYKIPLAAAYICLVAATVFTRDGSGILCLFVHRLCRLTGVAFWYVCTTKIRGRIMPAISFVAKYTFCIYLFHEMNLTILKKVLARLVPQTSFFAVFFYFGIPVIIIGFCVLLSFLLEKYTPGVYRLVSGGRRK